ncbi:MAG: ECF transporter S component [Clostridia bacterium]|nr:ECF transporter S component [Clostridia bacterium]
MKTRNDRLLKLVLAAMFAAFGCVATMVIQIPAPTGYVNLGDVIVILAGFTLGPVYGFVAGGLGPAMADLLLGYGMYAPGTFVIKGLVAVIASLILLVYYKLKKEPTVSRLLVCTILAEGFMVLGYFVYEMMILKYGIGAAAAIPANLMQGLVGVVASVVLFRLLYKVPALRDRFWKG